MYRNLSVGLFATLMGACAIASSAQSAAQITKPVNENQRLTAGDVRPAAQLLRNDRGRVGDDFALHGMRILMHRSTPQQASLDKLTEDLHNPSSPSYHKWLTAAQFAQRFGIDKADVNAVRSWLESHGFHVDSVSRDRTLITFSGNAGQVREAFRTEVHNLVVNGERHFANTSRPTIPAALKPGVEGLIALNDFRPHPNFKPRTDYTYLKGSFTYHAVVPEDLATIYNFNAAYNRGVTGRGQTIAVLEEGDIQNLGDWSKFRRTFGLAKYRHGSFTQEQPSGTTECDDPGVNGAEDEANLDAQWSGAAAPDAAIVAAACADSASDFGLLIAMENLLEQSTPPQVMSISYGACEVLLGREFNHHIANLYQQADVEGVSVFASTGDEGSAECDERAPVAVHGISVSGLMSTPFNVAVGGTDFADSYLGTSNLYWNASNDKYFGSAKSYMPEMPWDDSCANGPLTQAEGYNQSYGDTGFCNAQGNPFIDTVAGSGGPSSCATGKPSQDGVVSGTCAGYQKPSWQTGLSIPPDGVRDTPDVALMAANGVWGHYLVFCDTAVGSCEGAPRGWPGGGGTSFSTPIWAGIQALVDQNAGSAQGNPNPIYYSLATGEYARKGDAACQSSASNGAASDCIFYDVVLGDNDVDCQGKVDCYLPSGTYGILSRALKNPRPAFNAQAKYDFPTGLGTPNVGNLVSNWPAN